MNTICNTRYKTGERVILANKKALKDAIRVFSPVFDSLEQAVAIVDTEGIFVYFNQQMADFDGCTTEDGIGKHILERWPYLNDETSTLLRAVIYGEQFIGHHQSYSNSSGQVMEYMHTTLPIFDEKGEGLGAIEIGTSLNSIKQLTDQVLELSEQLYANQDGRPQLPEKQEIITVDPKMLCLIDELDIYSSRDTPLLIYGETGTGKELFVHRAHQKSPRASKPLISLNCAAIPETLMEGILFGTKKGAFTGSEDRKGIFDITNGGTIFLDELNSMPIGIQAKLLRVLQDGEIMRLGSNVTKNVDVRVITAMNEPPEQAIEMGHLRRDLYYRISVGLICIPSLRDRRDDIGVLADYFVKKVAKQIDSPITAINPKLRKELESYDWPGNVRMLENVIRRSVLLETPNPSATVLFKPPYQRNNLIGDSSEYNVLNKIHFEMHQQANIQKEVFTHTEPAQKSGEDHKQPLANLVDNYERELINNTLHETGGNIKKAAQLLQIPRATLQRKIKRYQLN